MLYTMPFSDMHLPGMRMEKVDADGVQIYNDAYNANPQSMRAGIAFLNGLELANGSRKIFVMGDMRDLGESSDALHEEIGALITDRTADMLITVGEHAERAGARCRSNPERPGTIMHCRTMVEAAAAVFDTARKGDVVYLKASRSVGLEQILKDR